MDNELDKRIMAELGIKTNEDKLTNIEYITLRLGMIYADALEDIVEHKQEAEHGESPLMKSLYFDHDKFDSIGLTPETLESTNHQAICNLIAENNQRLLIEMKSLLHKSS